MYEQKNSIFIILISYYFTNIFRILISNLLKIYHYYLLITYIIFLFKSNLAINNVFVIFLL